MADDRPPPHGFSPPDAPTRSIGPTVSDTRGIDPAAAPLLSPGQEFGPYLIVRLLGRGGMGEVYEAEDRDNGRHVALKVLSHGLTHADRARFIREGRLAAGINHPNAVYVYGTDDIEGVPVIAMELAPGGTLKDVVKARGPLPAAKAVDAILQVVSGLEAAADAGVLHRDVKPSNCFVDSDGTVKVGDFGLSISTQTFDERSLTMLGTVLGTPGFSSPEQLRGDELDVRSDIYSVGATLYYLLTGRAPFDDANVIRLVTQVAQEMPPSPRVARPDVPRELADVVMRALAKRPPDRFDSYEALRAALEPLSSNAPVPANLSLRFVAGFVDNLIVTLLSMPILTLWWQPWTPGRTEGMVEGSLASWVVVIAYYGFSEGAWGRSPAKHLFGLRVIDATNQKPGIPRGLARAAVWAVADGLPMLVYGYAMSPLMAKYQNTGFSALVGFSFPVFNLLVIAAIFSTARRANGYAALHDRLSSTRVVLRRQALDRRRAAAPAGTLLLVGGTERIGPYVLLDERPLGSPPLVTGYDDRLRRKAWIRRAQPGEPPVPSPRRLLARPARLRWLSGRRDAGEAWDAYEAPEGMPLMHAAAAPQPWSAVRLWLLDLATEIRAALADGSLPPLSADRVWITAAGRARLLEWSAAPEDSPASPQPFLHDIARRGLRAAGGGRLQAPLPLRARAFLARLERGSFESIDAVQQEAMTLAHEPATVRRGRRLGHLVLSVMPALFMSLILGAVSVAVIRAQTIHPVRADLSECLMRLEHLERAPEVARVPGEARALAIYVASTYAPVIQDPATWSENWSLLRFNPKLQTIARRVVAEHPTPSPEDVAAAAQVVEPFLAEERQKAARMTSARGVTAVPLFFATWMTIGTAALGLLSALFFRGGLMLRLFGMAVVTDAAEAGRLRAFWRAVVAWSPVALAIVAAVVESRGPIRRVNWMIVEAASLALFAAGIFYAGRHPERGLQDRLAGTWLVPR